MRRPAASCRAARTLGYDPAAAYDTNAYTMSTLVVVDGHNVYNDIGRFFESADRSKLHAYVRDWFDFDRLVSATLGTTLALDPWRDLGIVLFHSRRALGKGADKDAYSIGGGEASAAFWARQGAAPNTSAMLVEVPGARSGKDVGMDVSIAVYLFETADSWDAAVLFTHDGDFAPAVWSLRRRGKRVFCSSPEREEALPLVQSCQNFMEWNAEFLRADRALFEFLLPGGPLDEFLIAQKALNARAPQIVLTGAGIELTPGSPGSGANTMNEILRGAGLHELYAQGDAHRIVIQAHRPTAARPPILSGNIVFDGIRRHAERFRPADWHQFLVP